LSSILDSRSISNFSEIFTEFQEKSFSLLWPNNRDDFDAFEIHDQCDDHPDTLTVILDPNENIFGSFIPMECELWVWPEMQDLRATSRK
jgi:hypothetical protein